MTIPEISVEEIVEELFTEKRPDGRTIVRHQGIGNCTPEKVTQTLQAERQRCEEVVEAERERIAGGLWKYRHIHSPEDTEQDKEIHRAVDAVLVRIEQSLNYPNNPK